MASLIMFAIIFVICWVVVAIATVIFEFTQAVWWGATIRDDSELLLKIYASDGIPITTVTAIISGLIWYWLN